MCLSLCKPLQWLPFTFKIKSKIYIMAFQTLQDLLLFSLASLPLLPPCSFHFTILAFLLLCDHARRQSLCIYCCLGLQSSSSLAEWLGPLHHAYFCPISLDHRGFLWPLYQNQPLPQSLSVSLPCISFPLGHRSQLSSMTASLALKSWVGPPLFFHCCFPVTWNSIWHLVENKYF